MIYPVGWYSMSGVNPDAGFKENGTKLKDGSSVSLSARKGHKVSTNGAALINKKNYMSNWTPTYFNV